MPFGFTHQLDEDLALAAALAAKATHGFLQVLTQFLGVPIQGLRRRRVLTREGLDEPKEFF